MVARIQTQRLKKSSFRRSNCPVACTLDLIGDKWTLLVVRDLFIGKHRYKEFLESDEGITTNILAERLKRLEKAGLVSRARYQDRPPRYEYHLTKTGESLGPLLWSIIDWANRQLPGTYKPKRTRQGAA